MFSITFRKIADAFKRRFLIKQPPSNKPFPNKCDYCGLKQVLPSDTGTMFRDLRALYDAKIIKQIFSRNLFAYIGSVGPDRDEFCLISRSEWRNKEQPCNAWQLNVGLSKADCLSLHMAAQMQTFTAEIHDMTRKLVWLTLVITVLTLLLAMPELSDVLLKIANLASDTKEYINKLCQALHIFQ